MKTWIFVGVAAVLAFFATKGLLNNKGQNVEVNCPTCPICPADLTEKVAELEFEVQRLQTENSSLQKELGRCYASQKGTQSNLPEIATTDAGAAEKFKEQLIKCQAEVSALATDNSQVRTENVLLKSNKGTDEAEIARLRSQVASLRDSERKNEELIRTLTSRPLITSTDGEELDVSNLNFYRKNQVRLGVGYFDDLYYSAGYSRSLAKWLSVNADLFYSEKLDQLGISTGVGINF